jgi:hypothetical protein
MAVDYDRVYLRDALETYLDYSELLPGARHSVFGMRQFRELWIGVTPRYMPKQSSKARLAGYKLTEDTCNN